MVEAQALRREPPVVRFDAHVGTAEKRGRERDERGQRDQEHVEGIDEEVLVPDELRPVGDHVHGQRERCGEREQARPAFNSGANR